MICYPTILLLSFNIYPSTYILQHHSWLTIQTLFYILRDIEFLSPELTASIGHIVPLQNTHDFGECLYLETVSLVGTHLTTCNVCT